MEPLTLIAGALIAAVAYVAGRIGKRRSHPRQPPTSACEGCGHGLSYHDQHGACHDQAKRNKYNSIGDWVGHEYVKCTCQNYVGHIPADRVLNSFKIPSLMPTEQVPSEENKP